MNDIAYPLAGLTDPSLDPIFWPAERLGVASAWWPHVPFGHWITSVARPRVLVELGTGTGVSYSAFCQAVARESLDTRCYAIDTWPRGPDANIGDEEMFGELASFHYERYGAFSTLLRGSFDEALSHFADRTVDLLHIDDLQTYEAVRLNFERWKPKLSSRAVVLLHNTNMRGGDFGVWRLWSELCQQFPNFEFLHGNGLGLLAVGDDMPPAIVALCGLADSSSAAAVRSRFAAMGERWLCDARENLGAQDLGRRIAAAAADAEQARAEVHAWKERAEDHARAREQIAFRMNAARRDVYNANLHAEEAEAALALAVQQADAAVALADHRAEAAVALADHRAEAAVALAAHRAEQAQAAAALVRMELEHVVQERDTLLSSTAWRATWPMRTAAHHLPPGLRRMLHAGAKIGWWSLTFKLPHRLGERRAARADHFESTVKQEPNAAPFSEVRLRPEGGLSSQPSCTGREEC